MPVTELGTVILHYVSNFNLYRYQVILVIINLLIFFERVKTTCLVVNCEYQCMKAIKIFSQLI